MQVIVKDFAISMEVKNKGIELQVSGTDGKHRGDLVITKTKLVWCPGKTTVANGKAITWEKFIAMMNDQ